MPMSTPSRVRHPLEEDIEDLLSRLQVWLGRVGKVDTALEPLVFGAIRDLYDLLDESYDDIKTIELGKRVYAAMHRANELAPCRSRLPGSGILRTPSPSESSGFDATTVQQPLLARSPEMPPPRRALIRPPSSASLSASSETTEVDGEPHKTDTRLKRERFISDDDEPEETRPTSRRRIASSFDSDSDSEEDEDETRPPSSFDFDTDSDSDSDSEEDDDETRPPSSFDFDTDSEGDEDEDDSDSDSEEDEDETRSASSFDFDSDSEGDEDEDDNKVLDLPRKYKRLCHPCLE